MRIKHSTVSFRPLASSTSSASPTPSRRRNRRRFAAGVAGIGTLALLTGFGGTAWAQEGPKTDPTKVDLTRDHVLFEIGYSHLDTEWCWNYPQVINQFVSDTLHQNFALFEKYPDYTFNWTGANRYRFMQEYYPQDWVTLKKYVAQGRWFPNGSSLEEGDVNNPSPESIIRQVMYGNNYFRQQFGKAGTDFMLPDCFGFPASLPTILAHAGVKGFSTQKLTWGSAVGIPFNFGVWVGPDDTGVLAALNGGSYTNQVGDDRSQNAEFFKRVDEDGKKSGLYADYVYYGKGDRGGSAGEGSAPFIEQSVHGTGPLKVVSGNADTLFNMVTPSQQAKLPTYKGDLELTQHSAGSLTSQSIIKHWNRQNEILADAAEKASVGAMLLGAQPYPMARITDAWWRFLPGQFHDIMAGTALPKSYEFADNDQAIALNEFSDVIAKSVGGISQGLDTRRTFGNTSLVVYNALSAPREDVVEADVPLSDNMPEFVDVHGPDGRAVPAQIVGKSDNFAHVVFCASVPSVGMAVYSFVPHQAKDSRELSVSANSLENARYRVKLNPAGDIASIFDKKASKELLAAPMRLAFQYENPREYPAWNMDWSDQQKPPRGYVEGPAKVEIVENGPVRVALRVTRTSEGSTFAQTVRLASGAAGNRVEFVNDIDWKSRECALKAVFPLTISNPNATYNWGMGTITRGNNYDRRYEAASQQWFDLTAPDNAYGVTVLTDDKHGSDKPDDNTLRLTLLYTPGTQAGYQHQATQDWGRHHIVYGLEGHTGDWRQGDSQWEAARLNQPLMAFHANAHPGALGKSFSLATVSTPQVRIDALKRAEADDDTVIVRFNELSGTPAKAVRLKMAAPILRMQEVNGQEQTIPATEAATVEKGELVFDMAAYRPRAFAVHLGKAPATLTAPTSTPITLPFDTAATSSATGQHDGAFDADGRSLPGELLPTSLESGGVQFAMGPTTPGAKNAVACAGQTLTLPAAVAAKGAHLYMLAAAYGGDTPASFGYGSVSVRMTIQDWSGYVGQWDNRLWEGVVPELTYNQTNPMIGLVPGFVKPATIAWYANHWRLADGKNEAYRFCYLYRYEIPMPYGAKTVTLPNNPKIRVFAASVVSDSVEEVAVAAPLYDNLAGHGGNTPPTISPATGSFHDTTAVTVTPPLYYGPGSEMRYTTDGSEPTASSPTTNGTVLLAQSATLKVRQFGPGGMNSPTATAQLTVDDTTPPSIASAEATDTNRVEVVFSEPLAKGDAENARHYALSPDVKVTGARLGDDNRTVTLTTDAPLPRSGALTVNVDGVKDKSPAGNATAIAAKPVALFGPVYTLAGPQTFNGGRGGVRTEANRLPTRGDAPWTINMFVYTDAEPEDLTLVGGFGDGRDSNGAERFLIKFRGGIEFWASNVDVATGVPFDLGKWQMVTATYDGKTVRVYKNGEQIKSEDAKLENAEPRVGVATRGPWDSKTHSFKGKVANFTIWKTALNGDLVKSLLATGPK